MAIVSHFPGGGGSNADKPFYELYSYTSSHQPIDDGDGNWRVKFLESGTLTVLKDMHVDIFAVGGGGNGASKPSNGYSGGGGGAGGYTTTVRTQKLLKGKSYTVTVGEATGTSSLADETGVVLCEANGGGSGNSFNGGSGGSGGASGAVSGSGGAGTPGSDGNDGISTTEASSGKGQGTTTREFGEATGDLYSGGGGGAKYANGAYSKGAAGGGGDGSDGSNPAGNGGVNTGGGGGGASSAYPTGGTGGSGIVIIRNIRVSA